VRKEEDGRQHWRSGVIPELKADLRRATTLMVPVTKDGHGLEAGLDDMHVSLQYSLECKARRAYRAPLVASRRITRHPLAHPSGAAARAPSRPASPIPSSEPHPVQRAPPRPAEPPPHSRPSSSKWKKRRMAEATSAPSWSR